MVKHQHTNPVLILGPLTSSEVHRLTPLEVSSGRLYDEAWLQKFVFNYPNALPIYEIEPAFGPLIPVCMELPTPAGFLDLLFVNSEGLLTLVECKLWKNPQARRQVVGQILDYAKELSRWTYEQLQSAVQKGLADQVPRTSLFARVSQREADIDERVFIDCVSRNLRRGRFLLLVVGEGIHEGVEHIVDYLHGHAHLNFTLALVELRLFKLPEQLPEGILIQPRTLAKTIEIERSVLRIADGHIIVDPVRPTKEDAGKTLTEQIFYEIVRISPHSVTKLQEFIKEAKDRGLVAVPGKASVMLKSEDEMFNFIVFNKHGTVYNVGVANDEYGIGDVYLDRLAGLLPSGTVDRRSPYRFNWTVKRDGRFVTIDEFLAIADRWLELAEQTMNEIRRRKGESVSRQSG